MNTGNYSDDYLLSQLGVPYDRTPAHETLANALTLAAALQAGTYRTPGFQPTRVLPIEVDPANVDAESAAEMALQAAIAVGDVALVHADVDLVNRYRRLCGLPEFIPHSDFDILCHAPGSLGELGRKLASMKQNNDVPPAIFDAGFVKDLMQRSQLAAKPAPPVVSAMAVPDWDTTPFDTVVTDAAGIRWRKVRTPFQRNGIYVRES